MIEQEFEEYLICDAELPVTDFTADISQLIIQLMHASRLEVHIVVRTKVPFIAERGTHMYHTQVCVHTRARAIHSNDSVSFYTDTASCHFVDHKLTFILLETGRFESQSASRH